jgi:hypothetical protein
LYQVTAGGCLTHGNERNALVLLIASNASAARVEHRFAVHQETIPVMTVRKLHLKEPTTVHLSAHGMGERIPAIEIAN